MVTNHYLATVVRYLYPMSHMFITCAVTISGQHSKRYSQVNETFQPGDILKFQTYDVLPVHDENFRQQLHSHQMIQNEEKVEGLGITGNGH